MCIDILNAIPTNPPFFLVFFRRFVIYKPVCVLHFLTGRLALLSNSFIFCQRLSASLYYRRDERCLFLWALTSVRGLFSLFFRALAALSSFLTIFTPRFAPAPLLFLLGNVHLIDNRE